MTTDLSRLSDGTYGRELGRISPEGNIYGTTRWVRDVLRNFWWNGADWLEIGEDIGQSNSVQLLPTTPQEPDTVWRCLDRYEEDKARYVWKYFFFDAESQTWQPILWHWTVDSVQELPNNPWFRGQAHEVKEPDVQAMWDGYTWRRIRISSLEDDLGIVSTLDMYGGTLQSLSPDVELIFMSPIELTLKPINNDFQFVTVNNTIIDSSKRTSVFSFTPVLDWWDETESFSLTSLQHSTLETPEQYWVYLANKKDAFNLGTYDFRGKLFCSKTSPVNSRLGKFGTTGYDAILIGRCQTEVPVNVSDRVEFLYELDVSLVDKSPDLKETFREFSDFDIVYVNETTLRLKRTYGTAGQIFIGGQLYFLGESIDLSISDTRINVNGDGTLSFDYDPNLSPGTYYIYISNDSDIYNDNEINPVTNTPWHPEDEGAGDGSEGPYFYVKDVRLRMFLSTKSPEEARLSETWQGYWCRYIGRVEVDSAKKFRYSGDISAIRQMVLSPTVFDGLAEISIEPRSTEEFRIIKAAGTSGICMVGGKGVQTYITTSTAPMVHKVLYTDKVYTYTGSQTNPLTWGGTYLYQYKTSFAYLYLSNDNPVWDSLFVSQGRTRNSGTGCLFLATNTPTDAYLGGSFPGSNARWIATIGMDASGKFSGSYIAENLKQPTGNSSVPSGTILDFGGPTCPNGFLVCNGSWYYPAQYPNLWGAIGGYWGWNGSQFAVPNLNYACTIGTGNWGLGTRLGEINHTLSEGEMPAHAHYQDHQHYHSHGTHVHWHDHGGRTGNGPAGPGVAFVWGGGYGVTGWGAGHSHPISADATPSPTLDAWSSDMSQNAWGSNRGGSSTHNNMQPSAVVLKIIRY